MLPPKQTGSSQQRRLVKLFSGLSEKDRETLLRFAEFLAQDEPPDDVQAQPLGKPLAIERPDRETVVGAIKRLSLTYAMVDKDVLLHEASSLMTAHIMHGRPAVDVIDELETVFRREYDRLKSGHTTG